MVTDLRGDVAAELVREFERSYEGVRAYLVPGGGDLPGPARVVLMRQLHEYEYLFGSTTQAQFSRLDTIAELTNHIVLRWEDESALQASFRHEITHRFVAAMFPGAPPWVDEGLAMLLGWATVEEDTFIVGTRPKFFRQQPSGLWMVGAVPAVSFAGSPVLVRAAHQRQYLEYPGGKYFGAWALVNVLDHGAPSNRTKFRAYLADLAGGRGGEAFERHFPPKQLAAIDSQYERFLYSGKEEKTALALRATPKAVDVRALPPAEAHARWGWIMWSFRRDLGVAMKSADAAVRVDPTCADAYLLRGTLHSARDEDRQAEQDLRTARLLAPNDPTIMRALAFHLLLTGDWRRSKVVPTEVDQLAERLRPHATTASLALFLAFWELAHRRFDRALTEADRAIRYDRACTFCYVMGALGATGSGNLEEGERWGRAAISVAPEGDRAAVRRLLADLKEAIGSRPKVEKAKLLPRP